MIAEDLDDVGDSPADLRRRYEAALADAVAEVGVGRAAEAADLDTETASAVADGDATDLDLAAAAAILALEDGRDADAVVAEVRDRLLLGMSSAMLDVDRIAGDLEGLDPKEVQSKVEGRLPMTLGEYARLRHYIESRVP